MYVTTLHIDDSILVEPMKTVPFISEYQTSYNTNKNKLKFMLPGSIQTQGKGLVLLPVKESKSSSSVASRTKL